MASKRSSERPRHSVQEKLHDIGAIERRIKEVDDFNPSIVTRRFDDPYVQALQTAIDETLSDVFGHGTEDYMRYVGAARLDSGEISMIADGFSHYDERAEAQQYVAEGKVRAATLLKQAIRRLREEIEREQRVVVESSNTARAAPAATTAPSRRIFIVHGHDEAMREAVARVVQQLDFEPVILHEQPNQGRTLIEKFEDQSEKAQFAIVLLSPDDVGRAARDGDSAILKPRARQNVILELGYFAGKLGRQRVCALMRDQVDLPSDVVGLVYVQFDPGGAWRFKLATELRAAGYTVDLNRL